MLHVRRVAMPAAGAVPRDPDRTALDVLADEYDPSLKGYHGLEGQAYLDSVSTCPLYSSMAAPARLTSPDELWF